MGLASALSTSLTGLAAAETTIDVVGNNLANSNTVGFKASQAIFATQFLQTQSLGSKPSEASAGTNPRQIGLGTMVSAIATNFTQGTIEISTESMNMAIQGDGFFIVQGSGGEHLFTRNGIFSLSSENELTTVTGNRVLGFGVDSEYVIDPTQLVPLTINLGGDVVAEATRNVYLEGTLPPDSNNIATNSQISYSASLGTDIYTRPDSETTVASESPIPEITTPPTGVAGGSLVDGTTYYYRIAYVNESSATVSWIDGTLSPSESLASTIPDDLTRIQFTADASALPDPLQTCSIDLGTLPDGYTGVRVYRTTTLTDGVPTDFQYLGTSSTGTYVDDGTVAPDPLQPLQSQNTISGNYTYYVTFTDPNQPSIESRPSEPIPVTVGTNGRVVLYEVPVPEAGSSWLSESGTYTMNVYRNVAGNTNTWYQVARLTNCTAATPPTLTDRVSDTAIVAGGQVLDFTGPVITPTTLLVDIVRQTGTSIAPVYENVFSIPPGGSGTLTFAPKKGGASLTEKTLTITESTRVQDLLTFIQEATGIVTTAMDSTILNDAVTGSTPSVTLDGGQIKVAGNVGDSNAILINPSSMTFQVTGSSTISTVDIPFTISQEGNGTGTMTDFIAYDSLGSALQVRLTFELESCDSNFTTYRWYADCPENQITNNVEINCGTGLISFDGNGNLFNVTNSTVVINRDFTPASDVEFSLHFDSMTAFDNTTAEASVTSQDGSAAGTLTSFIIGEDGLIRGVYSNGVTRDLGQIRLARFANPGGLEQKGENLYATGINSGQPVEGNPGDHGIGSVLSGSVELSNTDIGASLIDLILASTMYRGNSRVITTTQEMFDELLNLQR